MGGRLTFPGGGAYHATKYAVEAMSDALRMEVRRFGIDVICIEPGLIRTEFGATAAGGVEPGDGPYAEFNASVAKSTREVYTARSPAWAATPTTSPARSRPRSRRPAPRPASRSPPPPA